MEFKSNNIHMHTIEEMSNDYNIAINSLTKCKTFVWRETPLPREKSTYKNIQIQ